MPDALNMTGPQTFLQTISAAMSLLDTRTRRQFALGVVASIGIAVIEITGLLLMIPLLSILAQGELPTGGPTGAVVGLVGSSDTNTVVCVLAIGAIGCFMLRAVVTLGVRWWLFGVIFENEAETVAHLLGRYLSAPYMFHLRVNSSRLLRTLTFAVDQTYSRVIVSIVTIITDGVIVLATVAVLASAQPLFAVGGALYFAVVYVILAKVISPRSRRTGARLSRYNAETLKHISQALGAVKHIQLGHYQEQFLDRFAGVRRNVSEVKRRNTWLSEVPKQYFEFTFILGIGLMILVVTRFQGADALVAAIGIFAVAGLRLMPSVVRISNSSQSLQTGLASLSLVLDDLAIEPSPSDTIRLPEGMDLRGDLVLQRVDFRYPGAERNALTGVDLRLSPGDSIALVGPSGAGKTTLIDLIMGLHPPSSGSVFVDDFPMNDVRQAWQSRIGLVPQDIYLLDCSIRENIAIGCYGADIDEDQVLQTIEMAQLVDLIADLPDGLDTMVGERGVRLSGGQKQRLGIARALYNDPRVLVLDEATSALDSITESKITATLRALKGRLTMITIAHRLSTVRDADRILLLRDGVVEADGGFESLRDDSLYFKQLAELSRL